MTSQFPTLRLRVARQMVGYRQRLAERINAEMTTRSWSVEDVAYKSGLSTRTIKRLQAATHDPRPSTVRRLAEGLDLDPSELTPEAEADQLQRLEAKLDEALALLRRLAADEQADQARQLADEATAEARAQARPRRRKRRAASR